MSVSECVCNSVLLRINECVCVRLFCMRFHPLFIPVCPASVSCMLVTDWCMSLPLVVIGLAVSTASSLSFRQHSGSMLCTHYVTGDYMTVIKAKPELQWEWVIMPRGSTVFSPCAFYFAHEEFPCDG